MHAAGIHQRASKGSDVTLEHGQIHLKAEAFFEELWQKGDPWKLETSEFEQAKYAYEIGMLGLRRYERVLEIGCGAGCFTRSLANLAQSIVAIDISSAAISRALVANRQKNIDFRVANIMNYNPCAEGPWDLVVMSETIYYLGWLYSFFDVAWLASEIFAATRKGGQFLMANTCGGVEDHLLQPWIIRTYHDLFRNVGYQIDLEKTFSGQKDGTDIAVLISVFVKAP